VLAVTLTHHRPTLSGLQLQGTHKNLVAVIQHLHLLLLYYLCFLCRRSLLCYLQRHRHFQVSYKARFVWERRDTSSLMWLQLPRLLLNS
jgi:hypothetical protein